MSTPAGRMPSADHGANTAPVVDSKEISSFLKKRTKKLSRLSTKQHGLVQRIVLAHDSLGNGGVRCKL